jgi:hypothetical protein
VQAGVDRDKVVSYPGFKEELYLGDSDLDQAVAQDLGLRSDAIKVLLRPPATTAHYHNPEAETILEAILARLAESRDVQLVYLPRTDDQRELPVRAGVREVITPRKVYDGPSLVAAMDMVISGGGTMTREAAIMGIPSYSFFRGREGMVDEALAATGRLVMLPCPEDVQRKLLVTARSRHPDRPNQAELVSFVCDTILRTGGN